jgi:hypothetical protein
MILLCCVELELYGLCTQVHLVGICEPRWLARRGSPYWGAKGGVEHLVVVVLLRQVAIAQEVQLVAIEQSGRNNTSCIQHYMYDCIY